MGNQRHAPAALPKGIMRYPLYWKLGVPQGRSEPTRKIAPPTGIRTMELRGRCEPIAITTILSWPIPTFGETKCCCGRVGKTSLPPGYDPRTSKVICSLGSTCRRRRRKQVVVVRDAISSTRGKKSLTDRKIPR